MLEHHHRKIMQIQFSAEVIARGRKRCREEIFVRCVFAVHRLWHRFCSVLIPLEQERERERGGRISAQSLLFPYYCARAGEKGRGDEFVMRAVTKMGKEERAVRTGCLNI